jgi:glutathione S-transferase
VPTLYDAPRCPFAARARIVLAEKGVEYETVTIDLDDRPAWLYEKNRLGRVPVWEDGAFLLPESRAIMEYAEERWPEPRLLPRDGEARALVRLAIERFEQLRGPYYGVRRGDPAAWDELQARLAELDGDLAAHAYLGGDDYTLADLAYVPWLLRARSLLGVELEPFRRVQAWLDRLAARPAVAAEVDVVDALPAA